MECSGRPGHANARSEVLVVRIVIRRAFRAITSATGNVDHRGAIQNLVSHRIELISQSQIQREVRTGLELILRIGLVERAAGAHNSLALEVGCRCGGVVDEVVGGVVADG